MADEYLRGRVVEKDMKAKAREKITKPFMALRMGSGNGLFDKNPYAQESGPTYRQQQKREFANPKPFRSPGPPRSGPIPTFNAIEYMEDPLEEKLARERAAKKAAAPKFGGFKAIDCLHSNYVKPINPFKTAERKKADVEIIW